MSNFSKFKSWLAKALKTRLIFVIQDGNYIVSDGYVAYNLRSNSYLNELKMQTFQELDKNFSIIYRQIDFKKQTINFLDLFKASEEAKLTSIYIDVKNNAKARMFIIGDKQVFISEDYIKGIDIYEYEIYGTDELTPIVFKSMDLDYLVLPIRHPCNKYKISILMN